MQELDEFGVGALGLALGEPSPRQKNRPEAGGEEVDELAVVAELLKMATFRCDQRDLQAEDATSPWETVFEDERPGCRGPVAPPPGVVVRLSEPRDNESGHDEGGEIILLLQPLRVHAAATPAIAASRTLDSRGSETCLSVDRP